MTRFVQLKVGNYVFLESALSLQFAALLFTLLLALSGFA
jgi:hypothetical protein